MGKLIAFKPAIAGMRFRTVPGGSGTVVVFTGVWQERANDQEKQTKRPRQGSGKQSKKSSGKPASEPRA